MTPTSHFVLLRKGANRGGKNDTSRHQKEHRTALPCVAAVGGTNSLRNRRLHCSVSHQTHSEWRTSEDICAHDTEVYDKFPSEPHETGKNRGAWQRW